MLKIDKINQILNDFLAPFDCECRLGTDFGYYTADNLIEYALVVSEKANKAFLNFAEDMFPNVKADIFLWSFLHELGHHETEDDFDDEDWEDYMKICQLGIDNEAYFNLEIESAATRWAGDFIQTHVEEVARLWQDLAAALQELYTSLNITP